MKFTSDLTDKDGYCWYIEMEYPIPKIGFCQKCLYKFFDDRMTDITPYLGKYYLVGDVIQSVDDVEIGV